MNAIEGRAWKFGDNVDTDVIIPARFCVTLDTHELGLHAMAGLDEGFATKVSRGDIVVAGANFGCGSSRETAPLALLGAGVGAVVAVSFARIFFRNAINVGLPIIEAPSAFAECEEGNLFRIDPGAGAVTNVTMGRSYQAPPFPTEIRQIIASGGLVPYVRRRLGKTSVLDLSGSHE
jgi:3-isopropylmalate/(R)-2-methylmalate dehydratase small subunit